MIPPPEALLLAILGGVGFGTVVHLVGSSWQRLIVLLVTLTILQTLPQQLYRAMQGGELVTAELVYVLTLRVVFILSAVLVLGITQWDGENE